MTYIFTFLEGIASFISPCVLPLLPIYISYFAGMENKKEKAFINSVFFVLGFSISFIIFAIIANTLGNIITSYVKGIKILFGIIIIVLGLNYIEILNLNLFKQFNINKIDLKKLTCFKALLFGMLFSINMSPCIGTFLGSALLLIANENNLINGIILMTLYCIGLGLPFIISAVLVEKIKNVFNVIKNNFEYVKKISGIALIIMGIYSVLGG